MMTVVTLTSTRRTPSGVSTGVADGVQPSVLSLFRRLGADQATQYANQHVGQLIGPAQYGDPARPKILWDSAVRLSDNPLFVHGSGLEGSRRPPSRRAERRRRL